MKTNQQIFAIVTCAAFVGGCAATVPTELANARESYRRVSTGSASRIAPAEVHVANQALVKAEKSFEADPDSYQTRDLAYVAQRKAEIAEAAASISIEQRSQTRAKSEYQHTQGQIVSQTKEDLSQTRDALAASKQRGAMTAQQLSAEQAARTAAEQKASDAQAALAKMAAVKEEPRGMVITLSGSVLFGSNQSVLLPAARQRLDQVADVLLATRERQVTVEGHTDSRGSDSRNLDLSQRRADAVRDYLVQRDYQPDLIQARGLGEANPVTDNTSAEGRANNRRVEIIIARQSHSSN